MLLAVGWQGNPQFKILCGGEALSSQLATNLLEKGASLWNLYGPTETTVWSTVFPVVASERRRTFQIFQLGQSIEGSHTSFQELLPLSLRVQLDYFFQVLLHINNSGSHLVLRFCLLLWFCHAGLQQ